MVEPKEERKKLGGLGRGVTAVGNFIEKVIGKAKQAKETYEAKGGLAPILSLESRLSIEKLKQLIDLQGQRFFPSAMPALKDKTVLEIGEASPQFQKLAAEKRPRLFCGVAVDSASLKASPESASCVIKGSFKQIPFEGDFFDCVLARLATPHQGDVVGAFKELGRVLMPEGMGLILDFHPFGLYAKTGSARLRSHQATIRGVEDYFKMCRVSGLAVVDLLEGFVDDTLRNHFTTPQEMSVFRELKGSPLVLFLTVTKPRRVR